MDSSHLFEISSAESAIMGYTIARGNNHSLVDAEQLVSQLQQQRVDVLKLNLTDTLPNLYQQLDALKLPYYVLGMVVEFKAIFKDEPIAYINEEITFEEYLGTDETLFKQLVATIFSEVAGSYYINPHLPITDSERLNAQCLAEYLCTQNSKYDVNKYTHLVYLKGKLAGFITSYKQGSGGGVTYAGVLPQFARKALFPDIISFIQNYGRSIGQKWGIFHGQLQNSAALKTYCRAGLMPVGHGLSVHVNCGFGKGLALP